jgi:macrodomain Ter protein organizer (MatP/YcbG family)
MDKTRMMKSVTRVPTALHELILASRIGTHISKALDRDAQEDNREELAEAPTTEQEHGHQLCNPQYVHGSDDAIILQQKRHFNEENRCVIE